MGLPRQLVYYLIVGGITVVVDIGLLALLHEVYGVPLGVATTVAYCTAVTVNFLLNRTAMSSRGSRGLTQHAWRYGSLVLANYLVTLAVVTAADHESAWYLVAKTAVVAASTSWNFLLYRYWIFATPRPRSSEPDRELLEVAPAYNDEPSRGSQGDRGGREGPRGGGPGATGQQDPGH